MKVTGIVLLIVGLLMMVFTGFDFTKKEKVVDLGPVEINKDTTKHVGWPVYAGGVVMIAGIVLLVAGKKSD